MMKTFWRKGPQYVDSLRFAGRVSVEHLHLNRYSSTNVRFQQRSRQQQCHPFARQLCTYCACAVSTRSHPTHPPCWSDGDARCRGPAARPRGRGAAPRQRQVIVFIVYSSLDSVISSMSGGSSRALQWMVLYKSTWFIWALSFALEMCLVLHWEPRITRIPRQREYLAEEISWEKTEGASLFAGWNTAHEVTKPASSRSQASGLWSCASILSVIWRELFFWSVTVS